MKRRGFLFIAVWMFLTSFSVSLAWAELELADDERLYLASLGPLKATVLDGAAPIMYRDSEGDFKGIAISIMNELASILDLEIEYVAFQNLEDLLTSDFDIALAATPNYVDKEIYLTDPFLRSELVLVYSDRFKANELAGKRFGLIKGGGIPEGIREEDVFVYDNRRDILEAINNRKIDYSYSNAHSLAFYDLQKGYKNIRHVPTGEIGREYSFGLKEEHMALVPLLNRALASIDDSRMNTLTLELLSNVERELSLGEFLKEYVHIFAGLLIAVVAYVFLMNKKLRFAVEMLREREAEITYMSYHDSLTGIHNRRYMEMKLKKADEEEIFPLAIVVGDVNNLKKTNDTHGHQAGDELLIQMADLLNQFSQTGNIVSRYGGDEFVILLYHASCQEAENLIQLIEDNSEKINVRGQKLSIALGFACKKDASEPVENVFRRADKMMYRKKFANKESI